MTSFKNLHDFLQMGGYAVYVWPAYSCVMVGLIINILLPFYRKRKLIKQLKLNGKL